MGTGIGTSLLALTLFLAGPLAKAETRSVQYPIQHVLSADSNPSSRLIEFVVGVTYPNGCFTAVNTSAATNYQQRSVLLTHIADKTDGECTQAIVNVHPIAELKRPESGTYRVWDAASSRYLGALVVTDQNVQFERTHSDPEIIIKEGGNYL